MKPQDRLKIDLIAEDYRNAVLLGNLKLQERYYTLTQTVPGLLDRLIDVDAEVYSDHEAESADDIRQIANAATSHLISGQVMTVPRGPIRVKDVADELFRTPPGQWTTEQQLLNERLRKSEEAIPVELGFTRLMAWLATRFGEVPERYAERFQEVSLTLQMRQNSMDEQYALAARRAKNKSEETK